MMIVFQMAILGILAYVIVLTLSFLFFFPLIWLLEKLELHVWLAFSSCWAVLVWSLAVLGGDGITPEEARIGSKRQKASLFLGLKRRCPSRSM